MYQWTEEALKKKKEKKENGKTKVSCRGVYEFLHDNKHHYRLSINPHKMSVVLLKSKNLKKSRAYSLLDLPQIILIMKRTLRKDLYSHSCQVVVSQYLWNIYNVKYNM